MTGKHLLIFSYDYPPSNGGIARLCQEIADGMNIYYTSVTVLTIKKKGISKPYNFDKVEVVELPSRRIWTEIVAWWYLFRLKNKKSTNVLCGLWHPEGALCILAGVKNVYVLAHGTELLSGSSKFRKKIWLPFYGKFVLESVKKVIANSHYTQGLINSISEKVNSVALPLAVNHNFFEPSLRVNDHNVLKICTVSRVLQFKGHDFIARSISKLPKHIQSQVHWNIGGTGSYLEELKLLVTQLNINHLVSFHGFVADNMLPEFYGSNDVFVLCTREEKMSTSVEGFGLVFLEAQSCGIPAIGTKTGGIPDAIEDGNGGWLIEQDNESELCSLIERLVLDRELVKEMGILARKRVVDNCTWNGYCDKLNRIIK